MQSLSVGTEVGYYCNLVSESIFKKQTSEKREDLCHLSHIS